MKITHLITDSTFDRISASAMPQYERAECGARLVDPDESYATVRGFVTCPDCLDKKEAQKWTISYGGKKIGKYELEN